MHGLRDHSKIIKAVTECCDLDCRVKIGSSSTTLMGWYPTYDKDGNQVTENPNKRSTYVTCRVCDKEWTVSEQYGQVTSVVPIQRLDPY